jgi:hypothetical protein
MTRSWSLGLAMWLILGAGAAGGAPLDGAGPPTAAIGEGGSVAGAEPRGGDGGTVDHGSAGWTAMRSVGAVVTVGFLLVASLIGYRRLVYGAGWPGPHPPRPAAGGWRAWFACRPPEKSEEDHVHLVSRVHLGARESIGVVRIGRERFLVGVSAAGVSLLARLESVDPHGVSGPEPVRGRSAAADDHVREEPTRPAVTPLRVRWARRERWAAARPGSRRG